MYRMYYTGNKPSSQIHLPLSVKASPTSHNWSRDINWEDLLCINFPPCWETTVAFLAERTWYLWKPGFWGKIQVRISFLDRTAKGFFNSTTDWSSAPHTVSFEDLHVNIALPLQIIPSTKFIAYSYQWSSKNPSSYLQFHDCFFLLFSESFPSPTTKWKVNRDNRLRMKSVLGIPSLHSHC